MADLNSWVLSEACARSVEWRSDIQLAVNCSVFQLRRNEAAEAAAVALEATGLDPDRLTIEVTETTLSEPRAAADLHAISRLGIQLTVDDMGSDWSSLENLRQFAVNTMKIDGSLIDGIDHPGGVNRTIVETIVKVSHSLDLCTVAEAVETAAQVAILREVGADVGQGYFFAPPMSSEDAYSLTNMEELPLFPLTASDDASETDGAGETAGTAHGGAPPVDQFATGDGDPVDGGNGAGGFPYGGHHGRSSGQSPSRGGSAA
jgi:EAL domain-containing protein (putative c-di-GMP-specific phosphodiesterase class I)